MSRYASQTSVSPEKSRLEIERTVKNYGATSFVYGADVGRALVGFVMRDRQIRLTVNLPTLADSDVAKTPTGRARAHSERERVRRQLEAQAWRELLLIVKAKLVAIDAGVVTFEQEWGMHFVMPDGRTVAEHVLPAIEATYASGQVRPLLAIGGRK